MRSPGTAWSSCTTRSSSPTTTPRGAPYKSFLLFLILAAACGGYYLFSCWGFPRVPCRWCGGKAARPAAEAPVRPVRALRRQGQPGPLGHADDREAIMMMPWLEAAAALSLAGLVLVRWLGSHLHLVWRYATRCGAAVTAKATVIRPLPAAHPHTTSDVTRSARRKPKSARCTGETTRHRPHPQSSQSLGDR